MDTQGRVIGSVLGLALGDALGAPFEFRRSGAIPRPLPAFELPWAGGPPGSTTDDTAMARNLVRSLVRHGGFDPDDVMAEHLEWFATNPPDVGSLTRRVLGRVARGMPASQAARAVWEERGPEVSAGNGSVMYCAPLGAAYANRQNQLSELGSVLSGLTHHDGRCRTAAVAVALATAALVRGEDSESAVVTALGAVAEREGGEELEFLCGVVGSARPVDGPDQGFCLFAAAVGLQAVLTDEDSEGGLRRVVGLGGDTDTNAAVAGALLGARDGVDGLPPAWVARLQEERSIREEARALVPLAVRGS
jgi:ADP-ribosyl-[dinitrogen reductase] hydrolase